MRRVPLIMGLVCVLMMAATDGLGAGLLHLGPEQIVQADGADIDVGTHSVPSFVDWDNDGLKDLVVGTGEGKVHVYLNAGTEAGPQFVNYFYVQHSGADLYCPPDEDMGCFPRLVYWDADARRDLLVGQADGTVQIFLNTGTHSNPIFDVSSIVQVGYPYYNEEDLQVGALACPTVIDWDSDGRKDLVAGALDGKIHIYLNCGCISTALAFYSSPPEGTLARENDANLVVPENGSSPVVLDLDGDAKKDLLLGNSKGQLLFYSNMGTDEAPVFSGHTLVESNGLPIDLGDSMWSRPFVCDWTGDGYPDVLLGAGDCKVRLYQSVAQTGDIDKDYDVDLYDFTLLAAAWRTRPEEANWNLLCDISDPNDDMIDERDLAVLSEHWLGGVPY